jgi:hypothetical protein
MIELSFTTADPEVKALCERYWQLDETGEFVGTVKAIALDAGLSSSELLHLVRSGCQATSTDRSCGRCGTSVQVTSRSDYKSRPSYRAKLCASCQEEEREERQAESERQTRAQCAAIEQAYDYPIPEPPPPEALSLEEAVYLLSIVRAGASEDLSYLNRLVDFQTPFTPWVAFDVEAARALRSAGLIDAHPGSNVSAFVFEDGVSPSFYIRDVHWRLLIGRSASEVREYLDHLETVFRDMDWPESWWEQTTDLWRLVARYECLEYLDNRLSEHGIPFEPSDRTLSVIDGLLKSFSVSQVYNIIWRKVRDATAFLSRTPAPRGRGADYAVVSMQKYGDQAAAAGWELSKYRRSWDLPVSMVAEVLYNAVLQIDGFNEVPS